MDKTSYFKDDLTGLTLRFDETSVAGEVVVKIQIANELYIENGQVLALPFNIPPTPQQVERERRLKFLMGL